MAERSLRELTKFSKDVGNTPLLDLGAAPGAARVFAKAEFKNPNGTVKDRAALAMLHAAVANALERGTSVPTILEYSGGSMAYSLAYWGQRASMDIV